MSCNARVSVAHDTLRSIVLDRRSPAAGAFAGDRKAPTATAATAATAMTVPTPRGCRISADRIRPCAGPSRPRERSARPRPAASPPRPWPYRPRLGGDVVVRPEHVLGVVAPFQLDEPLVVRPVRAVDRVLALIVGEIAGP